MKARIPLPNDLKSAVKTEIAAEWKKIQKEKSFFYNRCGEFMATADDNDVFWEQLGRVIIDTYGFSELGRDYTDRGKAIR